MIKMLQDVGDFRLFSKKAYIVTSDKQEFSLSWTYSSKHGYIKAMEVFTEQPAIDLIKLWG